jgi:hypothetical protein
MCQAASDDHHIYGQMMLEELLLQHDAHMQQHASESSKTNITLTINGRHFAPAAAP